MEVWQIILAAIGVLVPLLGAAYFFGVWKGNVDSDRTRFSEFMAIVNGKLEGLQQSINKLFLDMPSKTVTANSKTELTVLGEAISEEIAAKEWASTEAVTLGSEIKDKQDWELQELAFKRVFSDFEPDSNFQALISKAAFDHGITGNQVKNVLMVELRDALIAIKNL